MKSFKATTRSFFDNEVIEKIMKNPERRAQIRSRQVLYELAEELGKVRAKKGITQQELAKKAKISQQ